MDFFKIREFRKAAHKSQDELAAFLGVNRATVSKYETGAIEPPTAQLVKIAKFLNVRIEDLIGLEVFKTGAEFDERWREVTGQPGGYQTEVIHKSGGEIEIIDRQKQHLIDIYENLDAVDQGQLVKYGDLLAGQPKYKDDQHKG